MLSQCIGSGEWIGLSPLTGRAGIGAVRTAAVAPRHRLLNEAVELVREPIGSSAPLNRGHFLAIVTFCGMQTLLPASVVRREGTDVPFAAKAICGMEERIK